MEYKIPSYDRGYTFFAPKHFSLAELLIWGATQQSFGPDVFVCVCVFQGFCFETFLARKFFFVYRGPDEEPEHSGKLGREYGVVSTMHGTCPCRIADS